jgi:hypothetical protein
VDGEPQNAECVRGLGWATFQSGNRIKGMELLHKANKLAPGNKKILTDLAVANLALDFKESRKYAEQAVYSFYFSQKWGDRQHEFASSVPGTSGTAQLAKSIRIDSMLLYQDENEIFRHLFDYENKCWHEVELIQIVERFPVLFFPGWLRDTANTLRS